VNDGDGKDVQGLDATKVAAAILKDILIYVHTVTRESTSDRSGIVYMCVYYKHLLFYESPADADSAVT
jgi:hypothetical protein